MLSGKSQKELLKLARHIIQPLRSTYHKGQAGRICVFGGCEDYTGAPFFAAHSAALVGADLSHVVCEKLAGPIIKGYSPDLMVHPYLYESTNPAVSVFAPQDTWDRIRAASLEEAFGDKELEKVVVKHIMPKVMGLVERTDVFVVGPGFGRDPLMLKTLERVIQEIMVANKPVILDADALLLVSLNPQLIKGYKKAVITPNVVEFGRICAALNVKDDKSLSTAINVSHQLGGVVVVQKGAKEAIVRNDTCVLNDMRGSLRRVGGQGDTLTGAMATMLVWASHYQDNFWNVDEVGDLGLKRFDDDDLALVACYAACAVVRCACNKAFMKYQRAMQTSDIHKFLGVAYSELFERKGEDL